MTAYQLGVTVRVVGEDMLLTLMATQDVTASTGPQRAAFVRPLGGGIERCYPLSEVELVCDHPGLDRRPDGAFCVGCGSLIYASIAG